MNTQVPSKKEMSSSNYSEDEGDWDEPENDKTVKFQSVVAPVKPERPKDPRQFLLEESLMQYKKNAYKMKNFESNYEEIDNIKAILSENYI